MNWDRLRRKNIYIHERLVTVRWVMEIETLELIPESISRGHMHGASKADIYLVINSAEDRFRDSPRGERTICPLKSSRFVRSHQDSVLKVGSERAYDTGQASNLNYLQVFILFFLCVFVYC